MFRKSTALAALALAGASFAISAPAEARPCGKYVSKTTGALIGAGGGALLAGVLTKGSTGPIVGAAAGGLVGHEVAKKNKRNCRYRRTYRRG